MIRPRNIVVGVLLLAGGSSMAMADSLNDKTVAFLKTKLGTRVGGGECAQAVSEALRVSGAAFAESELGADYPGPGDYVWGTLVKIISNPSGDVIDSEPTASVQPGDVLQFHATRFIYVTQRENETLTKTVTAEHHTAVVAKVDSQRRYPTEVYEQNAPSRDEDDARNVVLNSIDFSKLQSGWVRVYRPKQRVDMAGRYTVTIVNNTSENETVSVQFNGESVFKLSLTRADTASSYSLPSMNSTSATMRFQFVLENGASIIVQNAAGYEIFTDPQGQVAIRKLIN